MAMCFICLESIVEKEKSIKIGSTNWEDFNIKNLIEKHLWPMETTKENSHICSLCLRELRHFHKFYSRVEEAHKAFNSLLSAKVEPIEEDNKPQDMQLHSTLEPDVAIGQNWQTEFTVKQEIEEDTPTYVKDTNHSPEKFPELQTGSELLVIGDTAGSKNNIENYEILPIFETKTDCSFTNADEDSFQLSSTDPLQSAEAQNSNTVKSSPNKSTSTAASRKSYYTPKTNRVELDKFLEEHFKFICCKCQLNFTTFHLMCKHFSQEHNERGFATCCEMKFYDRGRLVDHINCHLNPEYFKCKECGKVLRHRRCLRTHMKLHQEKEFECDICYRKFTQKTILERHKLTHLAPDEKKHSCQECGKFFANETILGLHKRAVHLSVYAKVCEICGQTMPDSNSFKLHMEKHAMNSESTFTSRSSSVTCEECGRILSGTLQLKRHRERQHPVGGNREYSCHICPKVSPTMRALKKHIRFAHEIGYDFKCTICGKAFKRSDNLKAHIATHTGTPLYQCAWCSKTFNSSGNMYTHRRRIHPIEWEESIRRKYSGYLPPNFKPSADTHNSEKQRLPMDT